MTARQGNFGEMSADVEMVDKGWTPRHERVTDIDANTAHGIDYIFTKPGLMRGRLSGFFPPNFVEAKHREV